MELRDTIKFLRNQDRRIIEFEDTLEVLRGSYSSLVDEISNLQVLSRQGSMVQKQDDCEERNISESLSATQQRLAPASNETLENFEDDHERKKALWREIFYILREKDEEFRLNFNKTWKDQKDRLIQNTIPTLLNLLGQRFNTNRTELANILRQRLKLSRSTQSICQNPSREKKMSRRASAFKYLHGKNDSQITKYGTEELKNLLMSNDIHLPEISDPGKEKDEKGCMYIMFMACLGGRLIHLLHNILDPVTVPNYKCPHRRLHMMRVAQPDGVPDWTAGGENEESDYSEEEDEEDEEEDDDDDDENEDENSNEKRGSGGRNGDDKRSGKRLAIDVIEECPNKRIA
ncbi:hypothetical protein F8M41_019892 [Gigaspora margarita]|uniref:Uncharacterized protein n=1 Tax=Gigaspora margarita TaxID=4874 RepID=A0A8H4AJ77_GIGMA|nr:hypothetical protein F8M41_019892 [Gigaspora margarita]